MKQPEPDHLDMGTEARPSAPPPPRIDHAASAARLALLVSVASPVVTAASSFVTIRLLGPAELALVAAANIAVGFFGLAAQLGVGPRVLRMPESDRDQISTQFWLTAAAGGGLTLLALLGSVPAARAIGQPGSASLIAVLSVTLLLSSLVTVPEAVLSRRTHFARLTVIRLVRLVLQATGQIALALAGAGAWSLVWPVVVTSALQLGLLVASSRFLPRRVFDRQLVRRELRYNGSMLGTSVANYAVRNVDYAFVSHAFSPRLFGCYYTAFILPDLIRQRLLAVAWQGILPVISLRAEGEMGGACRRTTRTLCAFGILAMGSLSLALPALVLAWFGESFRPAAEVTPLLCLAMVAEFVVVANQIFLVRSGAGGTLLVNTMARLVTLLLAVLVAIYAADELSAVAVAVIVGTWTAAVTSVLSTGRVYKLPPTMMFKELVQLCLCGGTALAMGYATKAAVGYDDLVGGLAGAAAMSSAFLLLLRVWPASPLRDMRLVVTRMLSRDSAHG